MPSTETLLVFTAAALLLNISPGASNFFVAWASGSAARAVAGNTRLARARDYLAGSVLVGLGLVVAQSEGTD